MAKKVVATLRKTGKSLAKFITSVKSAKSNAYTFKEEIVTVEQAQEIMDGKRK